MEIEAVPGISDAAKNHEARGVRTLRDSTVAQHEKPNQGSKSHPHGLRFDAIMTAALSSVFLSSLDENIIGTATSQITSTFNSLEDVGWYGYAYFLTLSSVMMGYNQIYELFEIKCVYLTAIALFEAGSLICGLAPNSYTFIIGRAIAGAGSAGINDSETYSATVLRVHL